MFVLLQHQLCSTHGMQSMQCSPDCRQPSCRINSVRRFSDLRACLRLWQFRLSYRFPRAHLSFIFCCSVPQASHCCCLSFSVIPIHRTVLLFWSVMASTCLLLSSIAHWFSFLFALCPFHVHMSFLSFSNNFQLFLAYDFSTSHSPKNGAAWVTTRGLQPPVFTLTRCYITS